MKVVIVGGSDAGVSAALRIRELQPNYEVLIVTKDSYPNFSVCGLPYLHSGEISDFRSLFHRTPQDLEALGIKLKLDTQVLAIDAKDQVLSTSSGEHITYDTLILGTGVLPRRLSVLDDLCSPSVFYLHSPTDGERLESFIRTNTPRSALIIGAGYIGVEMAEAFITRDIRTYLIEQNDQIFPSAEVEFATRIQDALIRRGVSIHTSCGVEKASQTLDDKISVTLTDEESLEVDLVVVAVGVRPNSKLAEVAGIELNTQGAIVVDSYMRTSKPNILAAGDVVHTFHRVLDRFTYLPLGSTAHKQGAIAGEVASLYQTHRFTGSLGTQVLKVFEDVFATTGLKREQSLREGFDPLFIEIEADDHKAYYPGANKIYLSILGDRATKRLLGVQMYAKVTSAVHKRIDVAAAALYSSMTVSELLDLDLSYNPPLGSPWDPLQVAAAEWIRRSQIRQESSR